MIPAISLLLGLFLGTTGGTVFGLVLAVAARTNQAGDELARDCECDIVDAEIVHQTGCQTHLHPDLDCDCD